ncbi:hypothetical protein BJX76DRAFT_73154 [Aspergillus varians]
MSCPPQPPPPDHNDALSTGSDYGSDFSADETDLLNQLLAQADAPIPVTIIATTPHQHRSSPTRHAHAPAVVQVPDIEDLPGEDASSARVPRVLAREKKVPPWQVQRGGGAVSDAGARKAGWVSVFGGATLGMFSAISLSTHPPSTLPLLLWLLLLLCCVDLI